MAEKNVKNVNHKFETVSLEIFLFQVTEDQSTHNSLNLNKHQSDHREAADFCSMMSDDSICSSIGLPFLMAL
jgi:hypothetical protein